MDKEIVDLVFRVVVVCIILPLIKEAVEYIKCTNFYRNVEKFVESANQIYTPEQWETKKEYVLNLVIEYANNHGIKIGLSEIDAIIEGFVIAVKGK